MNGPFETQLTELRQVRTSFYATLVEHVESVSWELSFTKHYDIARTELSFSVKEPQFSRSEHRIVGKTVAPLVCKNFKNI
jgi:hypothetical protein